MKTYRIEWAFSPTNHNTTRVNYVEAEGPEQAQELLREHIERKEGRSRIVTLNVREKKPLPAGQVIA